MFTLRNDRADTAGLSLTRSLAKLSHLGSTLLLGGLVFAGSASATECDPCSVVLAPNTTSAQILLDGDDGAGWLAPSGYISADVWTPPQHGQWDAATSTYRVFPTFFQAGVDQIEFFVQTADGVGNGRRTLILQAGETVLQKRQGLNFSQYSDPNVIPGWQAYQTGDLQIYPNLVNVSPGYMTAISRVRGPGEEHPRLESDPDPTDGVATGSTAGYIVMNGSEGVNLDNWILTEVFNIGGIFMIDHFGEAVGSSTRHKAQVRVDSAYFPCNPCQTSLVTITLSGGAKLEFDAAQRVNEYPGDENWSLLFWVKDPVTDAILFEEEIFLGPLNEGVRIPHNPTVSIGAMNTQAGDPDDFYVINFESFEVVTSEIVAPTGLLQADFEARAVPGSPIRDESSLIPDGTLATDSNRSSVWGDYFRAADLVDMVPNSYPATYVPTGTEDRKMLTTSEPVQAEEVRVQMKVEVPNRLPNWTGVRVLDIGRTQGLLDAGPATVFMAVDGLGRLMFQLRAVSGAGWLMTPWTLPTDPTSQSVQLSLRLEIDTAVGVAPNGKATLVVDGEAVSLENLNNSSVKAEQIALGTWKLNLHAAPRPEPQLIYFDDILMSWE